MVVNQITALSCSTAPLKRFDSIWEPCQYCCQPVLNTCSGESYLLQRYVQIGTGSKGTVLACDDGTNEYLKILHMKSKHSVFKPYIPARPKDS